MSKKILILVHKKLIPDLENEVDENDRDQKAWITEYDVSTALIKKGYSITILGLDSSLNELTLALESKIYDCVFNLLEEFNNQTQMESKVVSLMELYEQSYSGCSSKGLLIAKDKALSKKIFKFHHIDTATFFTMPLGRKKNPPKSIKYPQIVKCLYEEASFSLAKASVVSNREKLLSRIRYIHTKLHQDVICEEFIEGREIYLAVIGEKNLKTLPPMELFFENVENPQKEIYSSRAKWNEKHRQRNGIRTRPAQLNQNLLEKVINICKKTYRCLNLTGYARIDLRITKNNKIFVLEANPNPNIAKDDDFAKSASLKGISYEDLIESLINAK